MSRYRSYGQLDDQFVTEGDTFFQRMNARLRPNQLQAGEVALSQNGRMSEDGTWQPRKGLQTLSGAITLDSAAIRLPYRVLGGQRNNGVVTLVLQDIPSVAFEPGSSITVVDVGAVTNSPNGTFALTEVFFANKQIQYAQAGADEDFTSTVNSLVTPESLVPTALDPDFILTDDGANEIYGSCVYSDPLSDFTDDYIFTASNNIIQILRLRDRVEYKVRYPAGESIVTNCHLIQADNKVYVFRNNETTLECRPTLTQFQIATANRSNKTITITTPSAHGLSANQFITIIGLGNYSIGGNPNGIYKIESSNLTASSFEVIFSTNDTGNETYITGGSRVEFFNDFSLVANGRYTLPAHINDANVVSGTTKNDGTPNHIDDDTAEPQGDDGQVTIKEVGHGLELSQELTVIKAGSPIDLYVGQKVKVSQIIDSDHFTIPLPVGTIESADNVYLELAKKAPISFLRHMPAAPFGVMSQRRMWVPYFHEEDYDVTPFSWKARAGKDEIIASDILDPDTYDVVGGRFRVTGGSNDFIQAVQPFTEDTILVMCRRSIHRLTGASGSLNDVGMNVVTPDIGCAARKTIVQVGNRVLFLSDKGVMSLEFLDEYNLRGSEIPLSEPIQPYIDRINQRFIDRSVSAYFDNRYWLAVPLDNSAECNRIFIYSFLSQGWESIDVVSSLQFNIRDMLVGREGEENRLYITTSEGGVHKVDGFDGGDQVSVQAGTNVAETIPVDSQLITREYDCDTIDRKVFSRSELHLKSQPNSISDAEIVYETSDPDRTQSAQAVSNLIQSNLAQGEDASIRSRIRLRGYGCSVKVTPTLGRPYIRAVKVEGRITDRSQTSTT
jgi:hypothetical protein